MSASAAASDAVFLREGERIDDLCRGSFRLIQDPSKFCFGMDAVLLAEFAKAADGERVIDLGTGTGVIPTLMAARYPGSVYTALELNPEMADMAARSCAMNGLTDRISVIRGDIRRVTELFPRASFGVVTANPPYFKAGSGAVNDDEASTMARHEVCCTLRDVCEAAGYLLDRHGRFCMVHRPRRLPEIFAELRRVKLEPKRLRFVHPSEDREAVLVLIESEFGGNGELRVLPPLFEYAEPGVYSAEFLEIYENP